MSDSPKTERVLYRYASLLLAIWVALVGCGVVGLAFVEAAVPAYTLETLTTHRTDVIQVKGKQRSTGEPKLYLKKLFRNHPDEYVLMMSYTLSWSFGVAIVGTMMTVMLLPHWSRWGYAVVAILMPGLIAGALAIFWNSQVVVESVFDQGIRIILMHAGAQITAGVLGVLGGRPLARLLVRIFLPPRLRGGLAPLWMVDGKTTPTCADSKRHQNQLSRVEPNSVSE